MLVRPYGVFAGGDIFLGGLNAVQFYGLNAAVEVGQGQVADCPGGFFNDLADRSGRVFFNACRLFGTTQGVLFKSRSRARCLGPVYQDDFLIRAAHIFPVGYFAGKDVHQLLPGKVVDVDSRVNDSGHADDADLVVDQLGSVDAVFFFSKYVGVADIRRPLGDLGQTGAAAPALHNDFYVGVLCHELVCCLFNQRLHGSGAHCGDVAGQLWPVAGCALPVPAAAAGQRRQSGQAQNGKHYPFCFFHQAFSPFAVFYLSQAAARLPRILTCVAKTVAHATHCFDVFRFGGVFFNFLAQIPDVYVHGACFPSVVVAPDLFQEDVPGKNTAGIVRQQVKQLEFFRGELQFFPVKYGLVFLGPDYQAAYSDFLPCFLLCGRRGLAAQACLYSGHDFPGGKRFGYVVVRAQFKPEHLVHLFSLGAQYDHRGDGGFPVCL
ncbi:hypothetical membrane protein [Pelotomaculum thermopropionicum SI]|uniref:Hypothetical membrane protein n=1 Tax=Pelotomaculum thermopropionicum (strain DSM 13744 / JCM 10971 / SI) TaxID=370438 RepID=A5D1L5_PELTS|nr:hypothetical membrane protein [Pelotomaculum thermopropionicum SI]